MEEFDFAAAFDTKTGAERGFEFQLEDMHGRQVPVWITVLGIDSDAYQSTLRAHQRKRMDRAARGRRQQLTPEEVDEESLTLLVNITTGWRATNGIKMPDGQPFPAFSKAAAKDLYSRYPAIREQVDAAAARRENFLPGSAKN